MARLRSNEELRVVTVSITTFKGFSIGASHYYVSVFEADDAHWSEERQSWVTSTTHPELRGRRFRNNDFKSIRNAEKWANLIIEENFSVGRTHKVVWEKPEMDYEEYRLTPPGRRDG